MIGSTNALVGTVLDGAGFIFTDTEGVVVKHVVVTNAAAAITVTDSADIHFEDVELWNNQTGASIVDSLRTSFSNCVSAFNTSNGIINQSNASGTRFINGVLWKNDTGAYIISGSLTVQNSVIVADGSGDLAFRFTNGSLNSDYNCIVVTNQALVGLRTDTNPDLEFLNVSRWRRDFNKDVHSLSHDPGFTNPDQGRLPSRQC